MRGFTLLTCAVLLAIGVGVLVERTTATGSNERAAVALATNLLDRAALPRGARLATGRAATVPIFGISHPSFGGAIRRERRYVVARSTDATFDFLSSHTPRGLRLESQGSGGGPNVGFVESLVDDLPGAAPPIIAAQLGFAVTSFAGKSLVLVDAYVAWNPDRSTSEVVPSGAALLKVSLSSTHSWTDTTTDPRVITNLSRLIDAMPVARPVTILGPNCGASATLHLSFENRSRRPLFVASTGGCFYVGSWNVVVNGHSMAPLSDWNHKVIEAVEHIVGASAVAPLGVAPVPSPPAPGPPATISPAQSPGSWYRSIGRSVLTSLRSDASVIARDGTAGSGSSSDAACGRLLDDLGGRAGPGGAGDLASPPTASLAVQWIAIIGQARALYGVCGIAGSRTTLTPTQLRRLGRGLEQQIAALTAAVAAAR